MPTTALDVLSLDAAKTALRIDSDDHDAEITTAIIAAVQYCSVIANLPLVDNVVTYSIVRHATEIAIQVPTQHMKPPLNTAISSIKYWSTDQAMREEPTGVIPIADLGRFDVVSQYGRTDIYPPKDGWPDILSYSTFRVTALLGFDILPNAEALKQCVALMTRIYWEGDSDVAVLQMVADILTPFSDLGIR